MVEEHFYRAEAGFARTSGAVRRENVGTSNHNPLAISGRRKSKVSWAMNIISGLAGPKVKLKSVADGQLVNIPALCLICFSET